MAIQTVVHKETESDDQIDQFFDLDEKIKGTRNEAGWNSVYVAGKIIKKIGPILAIKNEEFYNKHVAKKSN